MKPGKTETTEWRFNPSEFNLKNKDRTFSLNHEDTFAIEVMLIEPVRKQIWKTINHESAKTIS